MRTVLSRSLPLAIILSVSFLAAGQGCNPPAERSDQESRSECAAGSASSKDRYVLTVIRSVTGPSLVRTDSSTCRMWRMRLNQEKWEAISPETRSPGEGLPVKAGRFLVSSVRSKYGPMLLCNDVENGHVYRMPMSGEGGWQAIQEADSYLSKLDRIPLSRQAAGELVESPVPEEHVRRSGPEAEADAVAFGETIRDQNLPAEFRVFAAEQLADISSEGTLPALVEALGDSDPTVVVAAVWALELNGDPRAIPELEKLLSHEDDEVRSASQQVIEVLRQ
jgi:hypothetical protein